MLRLLQIIWGDGFLSPVDAGGARDRRWARSQGQDRARYAAGGRLDEVLAGEFGATVTASMSPDLIVKLGQERIARSALKGRIQIHRIEPGAALCGSELRRGVRQGRLVAYPRQGGVLCRGVPHAEARRDRHLRRLMRSPGPYSSDMGIFFKMEGLTYNLVTPPIRPVVHRRGFYRCDPHGHHRGVPGRGARRVGRRKGLCTIC